MSTPANTPTAVRPLVFETAWEICQQLGGIYTVMRTKVPSMIEMLGDRYFMVGPYNPKASPMEFEELPPPAELAAAIAELRAGGLEVHTGRWLVSGRPRCILLGIGVTLDQLAAIKYHYWEHHRIDLPGGDHLLDQVMAFGDRVTRFFAALRRHLPGVAIVGHFHEWMASTAIAELHRQQVAMASIFTTHATLLGRHLAIHDPWFYGRLPQIRGEEEAKRHGIGAPFGLERLAARSCTVFSTVSEVTAQECEYLLGRRPDVILPNGLNIERYAALHEFQNLHRIAKEQIHQFVMGHFFPSYSFDLANTAYFFTAGRYEYHNKGFDLTLEALARLNQKLKAAKSPRTVVFFLITRRPFHSINPAVLSNRAMMEEMRKVCDEVQSQVGQRLFYATARQERPSLDTLVDERWTLRLRQFIHAWRTDRLPAIVTHNLEDDGRDEVLNQLRASNLVNLPDDRVKVVYHPDFINPSNPLFGMDYPQFMRGCHLGIFPSCYEPWGYTPMECAASGIPAVTSDFSGFGAYLLKNLPSYHRNGLYVVKRRELNFNQAADDLADNLFKFLQLGLRDRIMMRNRVEAFSENFSWARLAENYAKAHALATAALPA